MIKTLSAWPVLLLLAVGILLFRTPFSASDLSITPDSVEYSAGALSLATKGTYEITIQDQAYPPRYPPWFSLIFLTPAYCITGTEPGNAVFPILLFSLLGVLAAWRIGYTFSGPWGAFCAAAGLLLVPSFRIYSREIMSDIPCTALVLLLALIYLRLRSEPARSASLFWAAGLLTALCAAIRPTSLGVAIPFVILALRPVSFPKLIAAVSPLLVIGSLTLWYNQSTFGSFRNGYQYWCPVPCDYINLTFSLAYIRHNVPVMLSSGILLWGSLIVLLWLFFRNRTTDPVAGPRPSRAMAEFTVATGVPLLAFHAIYFFPEERFYLPLLALLGTWAGALLGHCFARIPVSRVIGAQIVILAMAGLVRQLNAEPPPFRRMGIEAIRQKTPANAVIISALDPVYLDIMLGASGRKFIPLSRRVEYASKLVAPFRISHPNPPPVFWGDHRSRGMRAGGAREVIASTASESPSEIAQWLQQGVPVFLDTCYLTEVDEMILAKLKKEFDFKPKGESLGELTLPNARPSASAGD
ncbi:MAG: hypothetical protein WCO77_08325 [bacterium]